MSAVALPTWPSGAAGVLCVAGPHVIPVSTAIRADDSRLMFALALRRETLARLRDDSRCAFCLLEASRAFSVNGYAHVIREEMRASAGVAALELRVESVQDHLADGRTAMLEGPRWAWRKPEDAKRDAAIREELVELAQRG